MDVTKLFDLSGKIAVVTGSTRGLGYAIAEAMIAHGATVIVSSESADDTAEAATALGAAGIACDVSDNTAIIALVAQTVERFGGIDILISNAGIQGGPSADPFDMTIFDRVIAINMRSMAVLTRHALPHMAGRDGASVILMASISGLRGNARIDAYALAKAGVAQLARNLAVQWGPKGVRTNAIAPGLIDTRLADHFKADAAFMERRMQMTPLRRMGQPHEIAGTAVFLASPAGGFVNGQVIVADGGTVITDGADMPTVPLALPPVRRVVTGHDAAGKAILISDDICTGQPNPTGTSVLTLVWTSEGAPVNNDDATDGRNRKVDLVLPGGSVIRTVDMLPGTTAPFHRTSSLDYGIVISGAIELILDDKATTRIEQGGIVIQRGTIHSWRNPSETETARVAFVLLDAKTVTVDGQPLPDIHPSAGLKP